jgi:transposase
MKYKIIFTFLIFFSTYSFASVEKGEKLFNKFIQNNCTKESYDIAGFYTKDLWEEVFKNNNFEHELNKYCKNIDQNALKKKFLPYYRDFFLYYAADSGNIPPHMWYR